MGRPLQWESRSRALSDREPGLVPGSRGYSTEGSRLHGPVAFGVVVRATSRASAREAGGIKPPVALRFTGGERRAVIPNQEAAGAVPRIPLRSIRGFMPPPLRG